MPKKVDPYEGAVLVDPNAAPPPPRAELVNQGSQSSANVQPDVRVHDPATFAGLTTDHALRTLTQQQIPISGENAFEIYKQALQDANKYNADRIKMGEEKALDEFIKQQATHPAIKDAQGNVLVPAGSEYQKQELERHEKALTEQTAEGAGPLAAARAQEGGLEAGKVFRLGEQYQKDLAAQTAGFYNLQQMHQLFDKMVQNTATSGGELRSGFGFLSPVTNATSLEARDYHSYVDFNLVNLAKGIQGDSAAGATKDKIQANMKEGLPNDTDNAISGGHKIYMMLDTAYHKLLADRDAAKAAGMYTGAQDSQLIEMRKYLDRDDVQKYNPLSSKNQPLVQPGQSPQAQMQVKNAALIGTNPQAQANVATGQVAAPGQPGAYVAPPAWGQPTPGVGTPIGAAAQQAGQFMGGSRVMTPEKLAAATQSLPPGSVPPNPTSETIFQTWPTQAGQTTGNILNWLKQQLPESKPQEFYQQ